ncbi:MAG TPA: hypothetical protein VLE50_12030 [Cellvibrio sp.]|nr:hypothetical protein [Cellvibrio sp.]
MTDTAATSPDSATFHQSLQIALDRLHKPHWQPALLELVEKFDAVPDYDDIDIHNEVLNVLWNLAEALQEDPELPLEALAAIRLSKMEVWTLRATIGRKTWNPIEERFLTFSQDGPPQISQSNSAYPAEDIIKRWARDRLQ